VVAKTRYRRILGNLPRVLSALPGDRRFAGNPRLAETAAGDPHPVFRVFQWEDHLVLVCAALLLVMAGYRDCARRTSQGACPARSARIVKAIGVMVLVGSL